MNHADRLMREVVRLAAQDPAEGRCQHLYPESDRESRGGDVRCTINAEWDSSYCAMHQR